MKFNDIVDAAEHLGYRISKSINNNGVITLHSLQNTMDFIESAVLERGNIKFGDKVYRSLDNLADCIDAMCKASQKKEFIPCYYDPDIRRMYAAESVAHDYLKKAGLQIPESYTRKYNYSNGDSTKYVLTNIYGQTVLEIVLEFDDLDKESGKIMRVTGTYSWVQIPFNDIHECIAALNSIIEPELLTNATNAINIVEKLTKQRNYDNITGFKVNPDDITITKYNNVKQQIRQALEAALATLNNINE